MGIFDYVLSFLVFLPAIIVHEVSHGWVALLLGDTTAKDRGRLSLNPVRHVDPFGTLLLPVLLLLSSGGQFAFGYAKPVPINPHRMRDYRLGMLLTGLAGPASNLALAALSGAAFRAMVASSARGPVAGYVALGLYYFANMNLVLMFFNLIPLPPLDGSRVLPIFLSDRALRSYAQLERYGILFVFLLVFIIPSLLRINPLGAYLRITVDPLLYLLTGAR